MVEVMHLVDGGDQGGRTVARSGDQKLHDPRTMLGIDCAARRPEQGS